MKVLLLNPPFETPNHVRFNRSARWSSTSHSDVCCYPIYLAWATGWLNKQGIEAKLVDAIARRYSLEDTVKVCVDFQPDMIVLDTSTPSFRNDCLVAQTLKDFAKKIVMVGPMASACPEDVLTESQADHVIMKEYDHALLELAQGENKPKIIQGAPFLYLDNLPFLAEIYKENLVIKDYFYSLAKYPEIQTQFSRGCYHHCNYCVQPQTLTNHLVRWMNPPRMIDEVKFTLENLRQVKEIVFEDDCFTANKNRTLEFCKLIGKEKLDFSWVVEARVDADFEQMQAMKEAGCRMFIVGFESGVQTVLDRAKKGTTIEQAIKFSENAKKLKIQTMGCFQIGMLGDTPETAQETFKFAKKVDPDFYFFAVTIPFPHTEFYEQCKQQGFLAAKEWGDWSDINGYPRILTNYPEFSGTEMLETMNKYNLHFALRPKFVWKSLMDVLSNPKVGLQRYYRSLKYSFNYWRNKHGRE